MKIFTSSLMPLESDPVESVQRGIVINYNNATFVYNSNYVWNVINKITVASDVDGLDTNANTGLTYLQDTNELMSVDLRGNETIVQKDYSIVQGSVDFCEQGISYDPINQLIYVLTNTTTVSEYDMSKSLINTFTFPATQGLPGSIFYDWIADRFYCSYDGEDNVYIWDIDRGDNTLSLHDTLVGVGAEEGVSLDYISGNIFFNKAKAIVEVDHSGALIKSTPVNLPEGSVNEGLVADPTDGTIWVNKDQYFHGGIVDGNELWHCDPNKLYDKYLRIPEQIRWSDGIATDSVVSGNLHEEKIEGEGSWISPIIDFEGNTMQKEMDNYALDGGGRLEFRGSDTIPSTTETNKFPFGVFDPTQTNEGWGTTTPSEWQPLPTNTRYLQIKVIII